MLISRLNEFSPTSEELDGLHQSDLLQTVEHLVNGLFGLLKILSLFACSFADRVSVDIDQTQNEVVRVLSLHVECL